MLDLPDGPCTLGVLEGYKGTIIPVPVPFF